MIDRLDWVLESIRDDDRYVFCDEDKQYLVKLADELRSKFMQAKIIAKPSVRY